MSDFGNCGAPISLMSFIRGGASENCFYSNDYDWWGGGGESISSKIFVNIDTSANLSLIIPVYFA